MPSTFFGESAAGAEAGFLGLFLWNRVWTDVAAGTTGLGGSILLGLAVVVFATSRQFAIGPGRCGNGAGQRRQLRRP